MIVRKEIDFSEPLTSEQIKMLGELESRPIRFDEDCPELTEEQIRQARQRGAEREPGRGRPANMEALSLAGYSRV